MTIEASRDTTENLSYKTVELPVVDPLAAVEALVKRGLAQDYWIYRSNTETIVALNPILEVVVSDNKVRSIWDGEVISTETATDPFTQVGRLLNAMPIDNWRAFGYVSFDAAGYYYPYPLRAPIPQLSFTIPKTEIVINNDRTTLRTLEAPESLAATLQTVESISHLAPNAPALTFSDRDIYEQQVYELNRAARDIRQSGLSKVVLSRTVSLPGNIDVFSTFDSISRSNPAARTFGFRSAELTGVGSSPELLMQTTANGQILTNPLAGTRPRGIDPVHDEELHQELRTDSKEIKEHLMSVRLAKAELETVCGYGRVMVKPLMDVASFRTVQHLSSTLRGQLEPGLNCWDGLRALFPGVTVTGINKAPAIEKIAAYESTPRGLYGGCLGWVNAAGASDFALALRSAFEDRDGVTIRAGSGIIAESVPLSEYVETVNKMRTIQERLVLRSP